MKEQLNCILLVDDNRFTNIFNERLLKRIKAARHIYAVKDGREALDYLLKQNAYGSSADKDFPTPDLILLDINMPVMDGWEFLREFNRIRQQFKDVFANIVIIILTTSPNPDDEEKAHAIVDIDDYFLKPITEGMIGKILERFFSKAKSE